MPGDIRDEAHRTGIVAFTEALGANLAEKGIRVNAVAPGLPRWVTFRRAFIEGNERGMRGYADGNPFERSPS